MKIVKSEDYWKVKSFFKPINFNLVVDSILSNNTIGQVNVDNACDPVFSYIWTYTDSILIGGNPCREAKMLPEILDRKLIPQLKKYGLRELLIYVDMNSHWKQIIPEIFGKDRVFIQRRRYYKMNAIADYIDNRTNSKVEIIRIDRAIKNNKLRNHRLLNGWVHSFWEDLDNFSMKGTGYCALDGDTIASWCLTVYAFDNERELGLETVSDYRSKGLATAVAKETIKDCKEKGYNLRWHCRENNTPSIAIAEKLGFIRNKDYEIFCLKV